MDGAQWKKGGPSRKKARICYMKERAKEDKGREDKAGEDKAGEDKAG